MNKLDSIILSLFILLISWNTYMIFELIDVVNNIYKYIDHLDENYKHLYKYIELIEKNRNLKIEKPILKNKN